MPNETDISQLSVKQLKVKLAESCRQVIGNSSISTVSMEAPKILIYQSELNGRFTARWTRILVGFSVLSLLVSASALYVAISVGG